MGSKKDKVNISFSPPDMSQLEVESLIDTLRSGWITTGPKTKLFEKKIAEYCHTNMAVCLNSATACMELTLRLLGIGEGDEVITSAYTYTASASPIYHVGASIVLVDTAKDSFEMDYEQLEKAITAKTKAIIPVDLGGIMCNYDRIMEIVGDKKALFQANGKMQEAMGRIAVVADAAHAFGAKQKGKMCGEVADFTSFSFHAVKNLTTGEGGALTWKSIVGIKDEDIYKEFMLLSLHGQSKDAFTKSQLGAWEYDVISPAYKCNMTDIMAGIGLAQLERYEGMLERRKEIITKYNEAFKSLDIITLSHYDETNISSGHLYLTRIPNITIKKRNDFIFMLAQKGIAANVHYKPLPMLTAYKKLGFDIQYYSNAYRQFENEITLPLHTCLTTEDVECVTESVKKIYKVLLG